MNLPLVLAGPIVRRVTANAASIWIALSESRSLSLRVWAPNGGQLADPSNDPPTAQVSVTPRRFGPKLFVAVLTVSPNQPFPAGGECLYDLDLGAENLAALGLVDAGGAEGALNYPGRPLPSFLIPPATAAGLRVAQASCRKTTGPRIDSLSAVDAMIRDANQRPHQMYLTGDQIYADDVASVMLPGVNALAREMCGAEVMPIRQVGEGPDIEPAGVEVSIDRLPPLRRLPLLYMEADMTTTAGRSHVLSFGEYCALHLWMWNPELWTDPSQGDVAWAERTRIWDEDEATRDERTRAFLAAFGPEDPGAGDPYWLRPRAELTTTDEAGNFKGRRVARHDRDIHGVWLGLAGVRRALANVSTYMTFDDHEVTDDWNLTKDLRDKVLATRLGRAMYRNALMAFSVCQGWGNEPGAWTGGTANETLLDQIEARFAGQPPGPRTPADATIDDLLALHEIDDPNSVDRQSRVRFHTVIDGPGYRTLLLDTRTWRTFRGLHLPPRLLTGAILDEQVPAPPADWAANDVLICVSPVPVLGPPVVDAPIQPLAARIVDAIGTFGGDPAPKPQPEHVQRAEEWNERLLRGEHAHIPGHATVDLESWANDDVALEGLLARVAPYQRVVFLSGDVHHTHSMQASYWRRNGQNWQSSRLIQLTASPCKNEFNKLMTEGNKRIWLVQWVARIAIPVEVVGWDTPEAAVAALNPAPDIAPYRRARMRRTPVILPAAPWTGVDLQAVPDWTWRLDYVRDERPDVGDTRGLNWNDPNNPELPADGPRDPRLAPWPRQPNQDNELLFDWRDLEMDPPAAQAGNGDPELDRYQEGEVFPTTDPNCERALGWYRFLLHRHAVSVADRDHQRQWVLPNNVGLVSFAPRNDGNLDVVEDFWFLHPDDEPDLGDSELTRFDADFRPYTRHRASLAPAPANQRPTVREQP